MWTDCPQSRLRIKIDNNSNDNERQKGLFNKMYRFVKAQEIIMSVIKKRAFCS